MLSSFVRNMIRYHFTKQKEIVFTENVPSREILTNKFAAIDDLGIYLHIPFCNQICPYCPYNKEIYRDDLSRNYVKSVKKEIDIYAPMLSGKYVTSFYIGGGTPTTMLENGIGEIISDIYKKFKMDCHIHMESHPNDLSGDNLDAIETMGVKYLSIGVEALQDRHLKVLERPYTVQDVKRSVERAVSRNFECVNIDFIFDLPGQTEKEIENAGNEMVNLGIHQAATYPLFRFPYTRLNGVIRQKNNAFSTMFRRRKFLKILEDIFYNSGFERTSVWAFTKQGIDKYCSVTVPRYLGLGASGSTYLNDIFYVNTFRVSEYNKAINQNRLPVSLSVDLTKEMQMAGWLYWRIYETQFKKSDFQKRFCEAFDEQYGKLMKTFKLMGYLKNGTDQIKLTDRGAYWLHAFEDYFSINYINKLWGISRRNAWPEKVVL